MEAQGVRKSTKNLRKRGPESRSEKDIQKVPKVTPSDPQNRWFRFTGATKSQNPGISKKAPKWHRKTSQNRPKILRKASPEPYPKNTEKKSPKSPRNDRPGPPKWSPKSTKNRQKTVSGPPGGSAGTLWPEKVVPEGGTPPKKTLKTQKKHNPEQKKHRTENRNADRRDQTRTHQTHRPSRHPQNRLRPHQNPAQKDTYLDTCPKTSPQSPRVL